MHELGVGYGLERIQGGYQVSEDPLRPWRGRGGGGGGGGGGLRPPCTLKKCVTVNIDVRIVVYVIT